MDEVIRIYMRKDLNNSFLFYVLVRYLDPFLLSTAILSEAIN